MGLAIGDEHEELAATVRRWTEARQPVVAARQLLDAPADALPTCGRSSVRLGWVGLAVSEAHGGQGYGLSELAVVLEELGRAALPGPLLATVVAAVAADRWGTTPRWPRRWPRVRSLPASPWPPTLTVDGDQVTGSGRAGVERRHRRGGAGALRGRRRRPVGRVGACSTGPTSRWSSCPASTRPGGWPR